MANYEKPVIIDTEEHYEGVYAASGDNTDSGVFAPKCDSKYMNGVWHAPDYNNTTSYSPKWFSSLYLIYNILKLLFCQYVLFM